MVYDAYEAVGHYFSWPLEIMCFLFSFFLVYQYTLE